MKIKFTEDKFFNGVLAFVAGVVHEIEDHIAPRWLNRGGVEVKEEKVASKQATVNTKSDGKAESKKATKDADKAEADL
jgi:hypothetical protein